MSILKDIIDLMKDFDASDLERMMKTKKPTSISKAASEGTLQFPVLITRSLDISTLNITCSALERQFASFAQIAMTMDQVANSKEGARGYLKRFHQNSGVTYTKNDLFNDITMLAKESVEEALIETDGVKFVLESTTASGATYKVTTSNKDQLESVLESLNLQKLNDKFRPKNLLVMEDSNYSGNARHTGTNRSDVMDRRVFNGHNILRDNDVKKSNELVPTTLHIRIILVNDNETPIDTVDFIVGVKAIMHPIKSEEMIENVYNACKQNGPFFNFIKWTTGEISFMKDLVLRINDTKLDVYNRSSGASHWWMALKRRKNMSKLRNSAFLPGGFLPNTTIVMSMEEVEYIKTRYGYDLMDERVVTKVMNEYFLLSFVVIDMAGEIGHFFYDGQTSYQSTTFDGLRRETSNQTNINEVIKMANRLRV